MDDSQYHRSSGSASGENVAADNREVWQSLDKFMQQRESDNKPKLLYRACLSLNQTTPLRAEVNRQFDTEFCSSVSMQKLSNELERHLGKTRTGRQTFFLSTTSDIQWTLHTTGQRCRVNWHKNTRIAEIAVLDAQKLRESNDVAVFQVADLCAFLESEACPVANEKYKEWANNCDEHVCIGGIPEDCVVQRILWSEIVALDFLTDNFESAFTLKYVRDKVPKIREPDGVVWREMVRLANLMTGGDNEWQQEVLAQLLKSDFRAWGRTNLEDIHKLEQILRDWEEHTELSLCLDKLSLSEN